MRVVIVCESLFGNTREVALAVAEGLREARPEAVVQCLAVGAVAGPVDCDLLVVGGPTHFFGMSSRRSRGMQVQHARSVGGHGPAGQAPGTEGPGVRDWLDALPNAPEGARAAAFDTRLDKLIAGGAAYRIARRLRRRGYEPVAPPEGFVVEDMAGPLRGGERSRPFFVIAGALTPPSLAVASYAVRLAVPLGEERFRLDPGQAPAG